MTQTPDNPSTPYQPPVVVPPPPLGYYIAPAQPKTSGLAIASLVLGICGFFFGVLYVIPCVLAIVFAGVALNQISKRGLGGKGLAIAGLVCGIVSTVFYGMLFLFVIGAS